jgi:26S proteasome regulatory subunit (ATPase 3-interacting protein)
MDAEVERLKDATITLKNDEKALRASLRDHASVTPLPELKAAVASLQQQKEEMSARLAMLKNGNVKPITAEERERVNAEHGKWKQSVNARRKIRAEMWKTIADIVPEPEKLAEVQESLGLESV